MKKIIQLLLLIALCGCSKKQAYFVSGFEITPMFYESTKEVKYFYEGYDFNFALPADFPDGLIPGDRFLIESSTKVELSNDVTSGTKKWSIKNGAITKAYEFRYAKVRKLENDEIIRDDDGFVIDFHFDDWNRNPITEEDFIILGENNLTYSCLKDFKGDTIYCSYAIHGRQYKNRIGFARKPYPRYFFAFNPRAQRKLHHIKCY